MTPIASPAPTAARFAPGTILAGRYRIIETLGRGGMGEVFRAEDRSLRQTVALKLLPERLARDPHALELVREEVRVARRVSHPNVCRVHDMGKADAQPFISMEYVDGEDLATLLRRVGRLAGDRGLEVARELCAGLAAAHASGVIHRDLKPANVMLDRQGRVRIADFGLARLGEEGAEAGEIAGTPAYMAPEQLAGAGASVRSDLYALGLVLYELFTGRRAFAATSLPDLLRLRRETVIVAPRVLVPELDPAVERAILRCLAVRLEDRPESALAVLTELSGGDPLKAALAAGQTPSPSAVAAAHKEGALRPIVAWACVAVVVAGALLAAVGAGKTYRHVSPEKPPEALADRASEVLTRMGYPDHAADTASWFSWDESLVRYLAQENRPGARWSAHDASDAQVITFWFRQSPTIMFAANPAGQIRESDPSETVSGMAAVNLDTRGRLLQLRAVPPRFDPARGQWPEPDWSSLFTEAGLNHSKFTAIEPSWTPPFGSDRRAAWDGLDPHRENGPIHIEAAAYHGRPVWFQLVGPWTQATAARRTLSVSDVWGKISVFVNLILVLAILGGLAFALRSARRGLGDRKGAFRIAIWIFATQLLSSLLGADHVPLFNVEFDRFEVACGIGLFSAGVVWVLYMALEPVVRRHWPEMLVSWSRLLAGGVRDPLVGRDVLVGCAAGVVMMLLTQLEVLAGYPLPMREITRGLFGARQTASSFLFHLGDGLLLAFAMVFLLVLFRIILRRRWLAIGAWIALCTAPGVWFENPYSGVVFSFLTATFGAVIVTRVGMLATCSALVIRYVLMLFPITLRFSTWYSGRSIFGLLLVAAIAIYGLLVSLAGRPLFGAAILEE